MTPDGHVKWILGVGPEDYSRTTWTRTHTHTHAHTHTHTHTHMYIHTFIPTKGVCAWSIHTYSGVREGTNEVGARGWERRHEGETRKALFEMRQRE